MPMTLKARDALVAKVGPGNFGRIARHSGLSKFHVARFLKGTRGASFDVACDIAAAAEVSLDDLAELLSRNRSARPTRKIVRSEELE